MATARDGVPLRSLSFNRKHRRRCVQRRLCTRVQALFGQELPRTLASENIARAYCRLRRACAFAATRCVEMCDENTNNAELLIQVLSAGAMCNADAMGACSLGVPRMSVPPPVVYRYQV